MSLTAVPQGRMHCSRPTNDDHPRFLQKPTYQAAFAAVLPDNFTMHGVQSQRLRAAVRHELAQLTSFNKSDYFSISGHPAGLTRSSTLKNGNIRVQFNNTLWNIEILIKRRTAAMLSRDMESLPDFHCAPRSTPRREGTGRAELLQFLKRLAGLGKARE